MTAVENEVFDDGSARRVASVLHVVERNKRLCASFKRLAWSRLGGGEGADSLLEPPKGNRSGSHSRGLGEHVYLKITEIRMIYIPLAHSTGAMPHPRQRATIMWLGQLFSSEQ